MAETPTTQQTFTADMNAETATDPNNLTPDEQDSLAVGEQMQQDQETLLAGKYKNAEELEKAYSELEAKLGQQKEAPDETVETEASDITEYLDDGSINFDQVNETYGEKLGGLFKDNGVDPWAISKYFHENQGSITDAMYSQLEGAGLSRAAIDSYLTGRAAESGYGDYSAETVKDLTDAEVRSITESVGGKDEYAQMTQWASQNLDSNTIEAFDQLLDSGNPSAIQLAVAGLKAQYEDATGYEGRMLSGKAPALSGGDVFRSQPELVEAMADPRYDKDPAYRQDVIEKLDRSDLNF